MLVAQTNGMGVDSTAWLTAVLRGDLPAPFDLADLTVVTAMVGDESQATRDAMEQHVLPLLREKAVRYVQVARAGWSETDGIVVLDDCRTPTRMQMAGPVTLSGELLRAGTIPQLSNRTCSYRMKGWVLDRWAQQEYGTTPRLHVVGYAAEETGRRDRDLGYAASMPGKIPWYPLIEAGWGRDRCLTYLHSIYGFEWQRSCCLGFPFQAGPDIARLTQRWRREPGQARLAVAMERNARAINPRMALFGDRSAADVARAAGLGAVVDDAIAELEARPAALYEVRRIYRRRGDQRGPRGRGWVLGPDPSRKGTDVWRSLRTLATGTWDEMRARLLAEQNSGGELEVSDGGPRLVFERASAPYPSTQRYLAVAVAGADKQRRAFEELWEFVHRLDLPRQLDLFGATANT